jgi:hypothetical protein
MNAEDLRNSKILILILKPAGRLMVSGLRSWTMNPMRTLALGVMENKLTQIFQRN